MSKFCEIHNILQCIMKYKKVSLLLSVCLPVYKADVVVFVCLFVCLVVFLIDFINLTFACYNYKLSNLNGAFVVYNYRYMYRSSQILHQIDVCVSTHWEHEVSDEWLGHDVWRASEQPGREWIIFSWRFWEGAEKTQENQWFVEWFVKTKWNFRNLPPPLKSYLGILLNA